ncbi:hypothetical protein SRABI70_04771 [Pseudomonas sp. Bi70]|nr:hypothetical protein SRABI70_04771 [Pseudomonas sp. Bi70]
MAMATRWLMPPESWCGKASRRLSAPGISTRSSNCRARWRAALPFRPRCWRSTSSIWKPTVKLGFRAVIGSWKIIDRSLPTIWRRWRPLSFSMSVPSKSSRSARTMPGESIRPISAIMVTDLPEPDSPTMASTSPLSTFRSRPSTTGTALASPKRTLRLLISSRLIGWPPSNGRGRPGCRTGSWRPPQIAFLSFGSSASRRPSPIRLIANTLSRIASPGRVTTHQARSM